MCFIYGTRSTWTGLRRWRSTQITLRSGFWPVNLWNSTQTAVPLTWIKFCRQWKTRSLEALPKTRPLTDRQRAGHCRSGIDDVDSEVYIHAERSHCMPSMTDSLSNRLWYTITRKIFSWSVYLLTSSTSGSDGMISLFKASVWILVCRHIRGVTAHIWCADFGEAN